jgi:hypothetical protein
MGEPRSHSGGCHCGKVRYEVKMDLANPVTSCNCSMCGRVGSLLSFVPATQFKLLSGEDVLTDYLFNNKAIHHLFCNVCGVKSFARATGRDGVPMVAINTRCLDHVSLGDLKIKEFDGRSV